MHLTLIDLSALLYKSDDKDDTQASLVLGVQDQNEIFFSLLASYGQRINDST
jgi:hypothetical protein